MKRYARNMEAITADEMKILEKSKVCVVGCGGLGGYIIELLARIGVGSITAIDGDVFDETNLNRQLFSHSKNIGKSKSEEAKKRIELVNPLINIESVNVMINESNSLFLLKGHDIIVDALDNIKTRKLIQSSAAKLNIPIVHGAIGGFYGQVTTIFPNDNTLDYLYPNDIKLDRGIEKRLGNPSFTPALIASIEVAEVIKILLRRGDLLRGKVLFIDLLENSFDILEFE